MRTNQCADAACIAQHCPREMGECEDQAPGDELDCAGYVTCRLGCGMDRICTRGCQNRVAAAAQVPARAIDRCIVTHNCGDLACVTQNCADEARTCGVGGGGDQLLSCAGLVQCVTDCGRDRRCSEACWTRIRRQSGRVVAALRTCMTGNRCVDLGCAENSCNQEYQSCLQDR